MIKITSTRFKIDFCVIINLLIYKSNFCLYSNHSFQLIWLWDIISKSFTKTWTTNYFSKEQFGLILQTFSVYRNLFNQFIMKADENFTHLLKRQSKQLIWWRTWITRPSRKLYWECFEFNIKVFISSRKMVWFSYEGIGGGLRHCGLT